MIAESVIPAGYKQTDIGLLPYDWSLDRIENLAFIATGAMNTQDRIEGGLYPFFVRSQTVERINTFSYDGEAVLTAGDGVGTGKVFHYINGKFDTHQRVYRMSEFDRRLNGYFFFLYFSNHFYDRIMQMTAKSSVDSVRREMIADMLIPLPPRCEQEAIAEALRDADALIESLEQLVAKKRHLKQAAMQQLLTGKKRLAGFEGEWRLRPIGEIAPLQRGFDLPNARLKRGPYPVVYSNGVLNHHAEYQVDGPGVVTGRSGTIGNVTFVDGKFWPHNTALWVTSFKGNHEKFIFYLFTTLSLEQFATGSGVPTLNRNDVHEYKVRIPHSRDEQIAIAQVLTDMDAEIEAIQAKLAKARQIKQGMMQVLLTGQVRLVTVEN